MVKLPRSSKLPELPRPSTAPPGPVPGTFCQAIGSRSAVLAGQGARSRGAARRNEKRPTNVIQAPGTGSVAAATVYAWLQDGYRAGERRAWVHRVIVVARLGPGERRAREGLVGGQRLRGKLRAVRGGDPVARGVLVDEADLCPGRDCDRIRGDTRRGDLELDRALRARAAAARESEQGESNGNAHGSLLGKTTDTGIDGPRPANVPRNCRS